MQRTPPVIAPGHTFDSVTDTISSVVLTKRTPIGWFFGFAIAFAFLMLLNMTIGKLLLEGIGIWGNNIPVGWAFDIINFVWWIGIGHAGTLISAILLLFRQQWRTSINRFAEAMTLFAVACAAMFPLLHTGRPWLAIYWLFPYPEHDGPVAAVPQPAHLGRVRGLHLRHGVGALLVHRARARPGDAARQGHSRRWRASIFGMLALGWRGSARHWQRYEMAYLLLAGISTPLVLSVHSRRELRLRGVGAARLARHDLPALLRRRRHLLRLRDGDDPGRCRCASSTASKTSSPCGTSTT